MREVPDQDTAKYWSGLAILERISESGTGLTSEEVRAILGTRSVKGIGAALSGTNCSLSEAGIRLDEAVQRRSMRGRTVRIPGPRIRQAMHALEDTRRRWRRRGQPEGLPVDELETEHAGPVLVLRALSSRGRVYRIEGGMAALDADSIPLRSNSRTMHPGRSGRYSSSGSNMPPAAVENLCRKDTAKTGYGCAGFTTTRSRGLPGQSAPGGSRPWSPGSERRPGSSAGSRSWTRCSSWKRHERGRGFCAKSTRGGSTSTREIASDMCAGSGGVSAADRVVRLRSGCRCGAGTRSLSRPGSENASGFARRGCAGPQT